MKVCCRDLGLTDYADCWDLQRALFDDLTARKTTANPQAARLRESKDGAAESTYGPTDAAGVVQNCDGRTAQPATGLKPEPATEKTTCPNAGGNVVSACTTNASADAQPATTTDKAVTAADEITPTTAVRIATAGHAATAADKMPTAADEAANAADKALAAAATIAKNMLPDNSGDAGIVLLTEHLPVYTLGKSGRSENLLVDRSALEAMGARFFHIDRGGDITFHGPGQLVCYPILDLERLGIGLRSYIDALEEAVIRTVGEYGIRAGRIAGASGVWIDPDGTRARKICAIGVRSSRFVTMHGFALNVTTDLRWFTRINPCGFKDRGVTSMAAEMRAGVEMDDVKARVLKNLSEILNVKIYNY